jgi:hypothetical protein
MCPCSNGYSPWRKNNDIDFLDTSDKYKSKFYTSNELMDHLSAKGKDYGLHRLIHLYLKLLYSNYYQQYDHRALYKTSSKEYKKIVEIEKNKSAEQMDKIMLINKYPPSKLSNYWRNTSNEPGKD